jgi:methylglutaconyl-CoA hydratase
MLDITHPTVENQGVATVTLARPDVRNAFNDALIAALTQAFTALGGNDSVRCIVLAAQGKAFCAGADLNWMRQMADYSFEQNVADAMGLATMLNTIYTCPKPVVARVQGACFAGGVGLVAACDAAFAIETAQFCLSEVKLGLIPATISPYVIQAMGARAARRYFVSAEVFDANAAHAYGLVSGVCTDIASLDAAVNTFAAQCLANAPQAMTQAKRLVQDYAGYEVDAALIKDSAERIATVRAGAEAKSGIAAFLSKQKTN